MVQNIGLRLEMTYFETIRTADNFVKFITKFCTPPEKMTEMTDLMRGNIIFSSLEMKNQK